MFEVGGEAFELRLPELAIVLDPIARAPHGSGAQAGAPYAALAFDRGESGATEHAHVLGDGGERHVEARCEFANRAVAGGEPRQDLAARGIGERGKRGVERGGLVNHVVYYTPAGHTVKSRPNRAVTLRPTTNGPGVAEMFSTATVESVTFFFMDPRKSALSSAVGTIFVYVSCTGSACGVGPECGSGSSARSDQESTKDCRSQFVRSPGTISDLRCTMGFTFGCRAAASAGVVLALCGSATLHAQGVLRGVLYDDATGTRLRGTVMLVDPQSNEAIVYRATDSLGQFTLEAHDGIYRIAAVCPGYRSVLSAPMSLQSGERITVRVPIATNSDPTHRIGVLEHVRPGDRATANETATLTPVNVSEAKARAAAEAAAAPSAAYSMRQRLGTGLHYDRTQMERLNVSTLGEFLQTVPGLSVRDPRSASTMQLTRNLVSFGGGNVPGVAGSNCQLGWFLDGRRIDIPGQSDPLTDALGGEPLDNLAGVEIFRGLSEMPPEFAAPDLRCGAIAIWTRRD